MAFKKSKKTVAPKRGPALDDEGFEIVGGDNSPMQVGEVVEGIFGGVVRNLPSKQKGKPPVPVYQIGSRTIVGAAVLRNRIDDGKIAEGDYLKVARLEDGTAKKGQSAPKMFDVRVKRASAN